MRRGLVWFVAGAALLIVTHALRRAGSTPAGQWGPLLPMVAGAWGVVVGVEGILGGWWAARAAPAGADRHRAIHLGLLSAIVAVVALAAGVAVWRQRADYWSAWHNLAAGREAGRQLEEISAGPAEATQSGMPGPAALEVWRQAAARGAALRPAFEASLAGARRLAGIGSAHERAIAAQDIAYYSLCLEWMNLYDRVLASLGDSSMAEPPAEWPVTHDGIVERIQALTRGAGGGS